MPKNHLKIEASALKLEFNGETENIVEGYDMTRELLMKCFEEQLAISHRQELALQQEDEVQEIDATQLLHRVLPIKPKPRTSWTPPEHAESSHLSVALCSKLYNKVCVLDRQEFEASTFGRLFHFEHIHRLHIRHDQSATFQQHFRIGKVLWRELTKAGRATVRKSQ